MTVIAHEMAEHIGHKVSLIGGEDAAEGLLCESCGEYLIEWDDFDPTETAVSSVVAWLRGQATGERTEDPGSDQIELIADFIEREHPTLGGR